MFCIRTLLINRFCFFGYAIIEVVDSQSDKEVLRLVVEMIRGRIPELYLLVGYGDDEAAPPPKLP